jgi:hypothetical protein
MEYLKALRVKYDRTIEANLKFNKENVRIMEEKLKLNQIYLKSNEVH